MMDSSSEQKLVEKMHMLAMAVRGLETKEGYTAASILELHSDVRKLLSFKASLLGWAAGVSGIVSLAVSLVVLWWKH